jgi:hypothetical protein
MVMAGKASFHKSGLTPNAPDLENEVYKRTRRFISHSYFYYCRRNRVLDCGGLLVAAIHYEAVGL